MEHRHYQEVVDALGRSLSLVTAPDPSHGPWLAAEARHLAHHGHPSIPTTYHFWARYGETRRGPGYLRRWITGETIAARLARQGPDDVPYVLPLFRAVASALAYLHSIGCSHGALSPATVWTTPTERIWLLGWQWVMPREEIPEGLSPDTRAMPVPPEWSAGVWAPTPESDQWQLAALCFAALTGEYPPPLDPPPVSLVRPDVPAMIASGLERALHAVPAKRHASVAAMLRALDRGLALRAATITMGDESESGVAEESEETRLRRAVGDDYEVVAALGSGTFGSVWRVRDLSLGREVALKMLHPWVAALERVGERFRREARLAAELAHPAIVPIYERDRRGNVTWYTMELAEGGSVADLVARSGPRPLAEVVPQIDQILDALATAHANGIVHRDLKPENILIDRNRCWRITDFGIATVVGEDVAGGTGTPEFAAPEQLLGERQGPGVDCFSLAAIVLFVLTGAPPFGTGDPKVVLARQLAGKLELNGLPRPVANWLRRALAPSPDDRFADATAMQDEWRGVRAHAAGHKRKSTRRRGWLSGESSESH